jgi:hypothetical protein
LEAQKGKATVWTSPRRISPYLDQSLLVRVEARCSLPRAGRQHELGGRGWCDGTVCGHVGSSPFHHLSFLPQHRRVLMFGTAGPRMASTTSAPPTIPHHLAHHLSLFLTHPHHFGTLVTLHHHVAASTSISIPIVLQFPPTTLQLHSGRRSPCALPRDAAEVHPQPWSTSTQHCFILLTPRISSRSRTSSLPRPTSPPAPPPPSWPARPRSAGSHTRTTTSLCSERCA